MVETEVIDEIETKTIADVVDLRNITCLVVCITNHIDVELRSVKEGGYNSHRS